jgi:hypothetical protein
MARETRIAVSYPNRRFEMPRASLASMPFVLALALMAGCGDKKSGVGGVGGSGGGVGGSGGGAAGSGGGAAGTGGAGGATLTSCPMARPTTGTACAGSLLCNYTDGVQCNVSCYSTYMCSNGRIIFLGNNDGCFQVTCSPDAGTDAAGAGTDAADGGIAAVCTPGADQTCNDNPAWSSIHGRCTDGGVCVCGDAGTNPDSGHCL